MGRMNGIRSFPATAWVIILLLAIAFASLLARPAMAADTETRAKTNMKMKWRRTAPKASAVRLIPHAGAAFFEQIGGDSSSQMQSGLAAGLHLDFGTGPLVFQTGAQYLRATVKTIGQFQGEFVPGRMHLDYVAVPLFAKFYILGQARGTGLFAKAGIMPMALVGNHVRVNGGTGSPHSARVPAELLAPLDVAAVAGIGLSWAMTDETTLVVDGTFSRGTMKVNKQGDDALLNQGFTSTIGAAFAM